jgi:thymidine phosphorylase
MSQPLANAAGNALEVRHAVGVLTGDQPDRDLRHIVEELGAEMLVLGGLAADTTSGRAKVAEAIESGAAAETFGKMVAALGGPIDFVERCSGHLPKAAVTREVWPIENGIVQAIDTRAIGMAVVTLGGGRTRAEDRIDPSVGLTRLAKLQAGVGAASSVPAAGDDRPLCLVHARTAGDADHAEDLIRRAYAIGAHAAARPPRVHFRIAAASAA